MFKNIIIIFLIYLIASLMIQKPDNVDLVVKDAAIAKEMVVEGAEYLHKTFDTIEYEAVFSVLESHSIAPPKVRNAALAFVVQGRSQN